MADTGSAYQPANRSNLKQHEQQPLSRTMTRDRMTFQLDPETETYHLPLEEQTPGKYGQLLRKHLHEHNDTKACHLLAQGRYHSFLEDGELHLETMYARLRMEMKAADAEPESYEERVRWLIRIDAAVHELVMAELYRMILQ